MADERKVKQLEKALNEKVYFFNELTRRKSEGERELTLLRTEIEKERKKSMADEATIRKLESILNEKVKQVEGNKQTRSKNEDAVQDLRQLLDD